MDKRGKNVVRVTNTKAHILHAHPLPVKVLTKIFIKYSLPLLPVVYLPPQRDLYPWKLGHVCSQWREALWNSSDIWSTIEIMEPRAQAPEHETLVRTILSDILTRTTGLISLSIHQSSYSSAGVSNLIRLFSHRFRRLTLFSTPPDSLRTLLELTPGSLQHLEDLFLFNIRSNVRLSSVHPDLPNLRTLVIDGRTPIAPYLPYFPLSRLTRLEITGSMISPTVVHFVLRQCSSLIFATLSICKEVTGTSDYQTTGTISSTLKNIDLSLYFGLNWDTFLGPLELPSLTTFSSSDRSNSPINHSSTFSPAMISLIKRSRCSLDSLSISYRFDPLPDAEPPHPDITNLLKMVPALTTFVSGYVAASTFIRMVHTSLTQLKSVDWKVEPDGLCTLLDLLDNRIAQPSSSRQFPSLINIMCCDGNGISSARARYNKSCATYEKAGIVITVNNVEYDDRRFVDERDTDSYDSSVSSVWAAGLGDGVTGQCCCCSIQ